MKRLLKNDFQFTNYKADLDDGGDSFYDHVGEPEKYPCVVVSTIFERNGVDTCQHGFVYPEDFR